MRRRKSRLYGQNHGATNHCVVIILAPKHSPGAETLDEEYRRSFLQLKLIRGWVAVFAAMIMLGLLLCTLMDRSFLP